MLSISGVINPAQPKPIEIRLTIAEFSELAHRHGIAIPRDHMPSLFEKFRAEIAEMAGRTANTYMLKALAVYDVKRKAGDMALTDWLASECAQI